MPTHYETLGVPAFFTVTEIKKAHRKIALECHPDKTKNLPAAEREARELRLKYANNAWEILRDEQLRKMYDKTLQTPYGPKSTPKQQPKNNPSNRTMFPKPPDPFAQPRSDPFEYSYSFTHSNPFARSNTIRPSSTFAHCFTFAHCSSCTCQNVPQNAPPPPPPPPSFTVIEGAQQTTISVANDRGWNFSIILWQSYVLTMKPTILPDNTTTIKIVLEGRRSMGYGPPPVHIPTGLDQYSSACRKLPLEVTLDVNATPGRGPGSENNIALASILEERAGMFRLTIILSSEGIHPEWGCYLPFTFSFDPEAWDSNNSAYELHMPRDSGYFSSSRTQVTGLMFYPSEPHDVKDLPKTAKHMGDYCVPGSPYQMLRSEFPSIQCERFGMDSEREYMYRCSYVCGQYKRDLLTMLGRHRPSERHRYFYGLQWNRWHLWRVRACGWY